jgi:hypothetical protein
MAFSIRRVSYFSTTIPDQPGEAYKLLSQLAGTGVNLLAFTGVPVGPMRTQLTLFPEDTSSMSDAATKSGLELDGPHPAFLVQGDDELGALAGIHERLYQANVNVFASSGVTDGRGSYGYILYIREEEFDRAAEALGV